ncbi:hypothetical protein F5Y16DRAFT_158773 [Xylariaceae sp. FL0255]|nr:hypothetical protein F5Y16DRAFT_158773 [Xylariaceae sp. FL0255]
MADHFISSYIPAGCLLIDNSRLPPELMHICASHQWLFMARKSDDLPASIVLPLTIQDALFAPLGSLAPYHSLWNQEWIQMALMLQEAPGEALRVRVYVLPHDIKRSVRNPRSELTRLISSLLRTMEYSHDFWLGSSVYIPQPLPTTQDPSYRSASVDDSLLAIFNQVPSPDPKPNVSSADLRYAMTCLLESQINGLTTNLWPYQGRSAALMLQREREPGRVVDPRFRSAIDQAGHHWYFDDVSGLVLKEPRYYDGLRGGILAEEMGLGKTLICLALILSTRCEPSTPPDPFVAEVAPRAKKPSLMDMAAATANRHSIPWIPYFEYYDEQLGYDYKSCINALTRPENRALYRAHNTLVEPRRSSRVAHRELPSKEVYLSSCTLIITPRNLVKQWQNEIKKHTTGLKTLMLVDKDLIPPVAELLLYDIILFSENRFEKIEKDRGNGEGPALDIYCPLEYIHFKRCIIDEGHKLGNGNRSWKNDVMRVIERLEISARWVVTGTPSRGLYGTELEKLALSPATKSDVAVRQEREDIQRIGNLTAKYLRVRPWANAKEEAGDSVADWNTYVKTHNRRDCLVMTVQALLVRHQLAAVSKLLPPVNEKIVVLDGSYQDQLSLNLFSMMIIFNSVQSQRTDMDYFFHDRQRKSLVLLVKNLRQASFFGGAFFSHKEIIKAVETAEEFLEKKAISISPEDETLLKEAIDFGRQTIQNRLKDVSNRFHTMPLFLEDFPGGKGSSWSLDEEGSEGGLVCTSASLIRSLQKFLDPCLDVPTSLQLMIDSGRLEQQGIAERSQALAAVADPDDSSANHTPQMSALAGNTPLGDDHHPATPTQYKNLKLTTPIDVEGLKDLVPGQVVTESYIEVAGPLAKTRIVSTASAKLSYLIDSIIKYQDEEQILVFYDNDNIAYYLAEVLEVLQIQHLIYSRVGLSAERRAQYVATFTESPKFRVLLMDISQAAYGLDMKSASRIYFISPVLNPQVVAQAIGRARRISQQKPVSVETLVLRNSIEEIVLDRRENMTQAEHSRIKNVIDDGKIKEWIRNARINPIGDNEEELSQTAMLASPQYIFGRGFGRVLDADEGLIMGSPVAENNFSTTALDGKGPVPLNLNGRFKRPRSPMRDALTAVKTDGGDIPRTPKKRVRIAWVDQEV